MKAQGTSDPWRSCPLTHYDSNNLSHTSYYHQHNNGFFLALSRMYFSKSRPSQPKSQSHPQSSPRSSASKSPLHQSHSARSSSASTSISAPASTQIASAPASLPASPASASAQIASAPALPASSPSGRVSPTKVVFRSRLDPTVATKIETDDNHLDENQSSPSRSSAQSRSLTSKPNASSQASTSDDKNAANLKDPRAKNTHLLNPKKKKKEKLGPLRTSDVHEVFDLQKYGARKFSIPELNQLLQRSDDEKRRGDAYFSVGSAKFIGSMYNMEDMPKLPTPRTPIVGFAGRSNVGKSSLINALCSSRNLAEVSKTPGRTQNLNFFLVKEIALVDFPGYGYAKVPGEVKREWHLFIRNFLSTIDPMQLRRTIILIDSRIGITKLDSAFMGLLNERKISFQILLTKCDTLKPAQLTAIKEKVQKETIKMRSCFPELLCTSSKTKMGISDVRAAIVAATDAENEKNRVWKPRKLNTTSESDDLFKSLEDPNVPDHLRQGRQHTKREPSAS